ncbi:STAS domain-containing protein [Streptomyces sp. NPDC048248]|uniref:STAS domain-containing protein n=1 Tax=Streptomyces sp. NPDC048248 TaxID=3365523 RepID=UPI00371EB04B
MTSEPRPAAPQATHVAIDTADDQRAVLTFSGVLDSHALRELEERLLDPRLRQADTWVWEMRAVERIDLACAYAVLRAATTLPAGTSITIRGAGRDIQRTLHHAGVDAIATIEE